MPGNREAAICRGARVAAMLSLHSLIANCAGCKETGADQLAASPPASPHLQCCLAQRWEVEVWLRQHHTAVAWLNLQHVPQRPAAGGAGSHGLVRRGQPCTGGPEHLASQ